jgi:hypothetical protein
MAHSHRPSFKGCCAMCAAGKGRVHGQGDGLRMRVRDLRKVGRWKRINRHDVPKDQDD